MAAQRKACLAACEMAIAKVKVEHPLVEESLQRLRDKRAFTHQEQAKLDALVAELDNQYLALQEAAHQSGASMADSLRSFAKARAIAALYFASKNDTEALMDAVYEAAAAVGDNKLELFNAVESAIK